VSLTEESDERLLELATPNDLQRGLRSVGCPGMIVLSFLIARSTSAELIANQPILGYLLAAFTFLIATPLLLAVVASVSSFSLRHARNELRKRLGQDDFADAVSELEEELRELPSENRGWVALIRGQLVTLGERAHVRLDLRNDSAAPSAKIESVRGPKLNLFGPRMEDLQAWSRSERELNTDEAEQLAALVDALGPDSMTQPNTGSTLWLNIALIRVGEQQTTSRCQVRINSPDQAERGILTLVERAWRLSDWATDAP